MARARRFADTADEAASSEGQNSGQDGLDVEFACGTLKLGRYWVVGFMLGDDAVAVAVQRQGGCHA